MSTQNFSGPVAQLVEQIPFKDKVPGSSPGRPTNEKPFEFIEGFLTPIKNYVRISVLMKKLLQLLSILQLSKEQPLTGFLVAGIKLNDTETLAEHHYGCLLIAYFLVAKIKQAGGQLNERQVILMLLIHDLGELFGGDIAGPLSRKYPDLREHKDQIGLRAIEMLSSFMDKNTSEEIKKLFNEMEFGDSDEHYVVKIIDQMDHQLYIEKTADNLIYNAQKYDYRRRFVADHIYKLPEKIKDEKTKKVLIDFLHEFETNHFSQGYQGINFLMSNDESNVQ